MAYDKKNRQWITDRPIRNKFIRFFRMFGCASETFDDATKFSGLILLALILYSGYLIPYQAMHPWFIWIFWM